ncbi:hypothetical protein GUJ93_ZPchr0005g15694 [Zizania palustris]|uniref:N-end rule aminoacyl transferase C-terminal domain-containing protein n=1 Tax=Zizania palustris TaxID=103762 RepID=A0A8J5VRB0_ZIZPA|nr:hypothetical protein GUJ93_ZPchr0005g15694 [Zizania palustris]KAG8068477.1 hypothetical protein GUJ93_ZPchr0005g15694 [Zizania palustris]
MEHTCCPSYTIRLKASDFICSKEQGRVLRKMQRFLDGELGPQAGSSQSKPSLTKRSFTEPMNSQTSKISKISANEFQTAKCPSLFEEDEFICSLSSKVNDAVDMCFQGCTLVSDVQLPKAAVKTVKPQVKKKVLGVSQEKKVGEPVQDLLYTCNISFQIVAAVRRALPKEKDATPSEVLADNSPNSIAEKLSMTMERHGDIVGLAVKACNGFLNFYSVINQAAENKTSIVVSAHAPDKSSSSKQSSMNKNNVRHPQKRRMLEIKMRRSHFDPEEFALYKRYQTKVHKDKIVSKDSYRRFLVDTPIVFVPPRRGDNTVPPCGFGSFHQQYRIDGKLVAVGVVDILPKCLSSKYLFWDPAFAFLSLGKYTALKEIDWSRVPNPRNQHRSSASSTVPSTSASRRSSSTFAVDQLFHAIVDATMPGNDDIQAALADMMAQLKDLTAVCCRHRLVHHHCQLLSGDLVLGPRPPATAAPWGHYLRHSGKMEFHDQCAAARVLALMPACHQARGPTPLTTCNAQSLLLLKRLLELGR